MADTPQPPQPSQGTVQRMGERAEEIVADTTRALSKPGTLPLWWGITGWVLVIVLVLLD